MPHTTDILKPHDLEKLRFITPLRHAFALQQLKSELSSWPTQKIVSYSLTVLLFIITIAGSAQLTASLVEARHSPTSSTTQQPPLPVTPAVVKPAGLQRSEPTRLQIPAINLDANLVGVGLDENGALEVPEHDKAGWYTGAPTPGEVGPAIIDGHLDSSIYGEAVFWSLRDVKTGDTITVNRQDGSAVNFTVEKSASYDQHNFPTQEVYGNLDYPGLRLITCDGTFDYVTRHYSNNLVVFAKAQL